MNFEAQLIHDLQKMSNAFTDLVGKGLSFFGTETFFLIVAVIIYWCVDKKFGFRVFNVYILGVAVTNGMKVLFKRTRPFNAYSEDVLVSISSPEPSYSFPSGHTESIASLATVTTIKYGKKYPIVPIVGAILTILVMLSRMYLGQHYLSDVFCGLTVGVFCAILFNAILSLFGDKEEWFLVPALLLAGVLMGVLIGMDKLAGNDDLIKGLGAFAAFDIGYFIEKKFVKYDVHANKKWWAFLTRLIIGAGLTIGIQQGFKFFLPRNNIMLYCFLRYAVMAIWASVLAPAVFKMFKI